MPIYVYKYTNREGQDREVERRFSMSEYPQTLEVEEDGETYVATLAIQAHARMKMNWAVKGTTSDLPDENAPMR